jgi:type VI secretion system protein ImpL
VIFSLVVRLARLRWLRTLLGVVVLAALVWIFGPLMGVGETHPLQTAIARYIVIGVLFLLWAAVTVFNAVRARRHAATVAAELSQPTPDQDGTDSAEEVAFLSERLREALKTLRRARIATDGSRRRLASLPWYMFIGPPGAGKTTALVNCGLRFPLADDDRYGGTAEGLRGVGGTRNCEWWFTDDAVLIDTAGRYTTQDSHSAVDTKAWTGFLRLLRKHRRREPLNGILVTISLSDLSTLADADRLAHARAIRKRVRELHDELGARLPVYLLLTKADLIAGFVEFFATLGREEREQVWGITFPLDDGRSPAGAVAVFAAEFDLLLGRLNERVLERVHQEPDLQRRRLIYGFPQQVASLREVLADFLSECFRPSRLEPRAQLRGVYLTSGTQNGAPIDRLVSTLATELGLQRRLIPAFGGSGRGYFLSRLIRDVVFGESKLVRTDPKVLRRLRWMHWGVYAGCALALLLLAGVWLNSYISNRELIAQVNAGAAAYNALYAELARHPGAGTDVRPLEPPLDALRGIRSGYGERDRAIPIALTFGLYQGTKLSTAANEAYAKILNRLLLPRLLARLQVQIAAQVPGSNPDILYQLLKVYLILERQGPMDVDLVMAWLNADLLATYPSEDDRPVRESIATHAQAMLQQPLLAMPVNEPLVIQARAVLNKEPIAEFSYKRLLRSKAASSLRAWTVLDNGGPAASRAFELRSGKPLDSGGVPGIYTRAGYQNRFKPLLVTLTQDIADEGWVLGRSPQGVQEKIRGADKLRRDVMGLYLDDYTRQWDRMLADIAIKPLTTLQETLDQLSLLSAPSSPLRDLLNSIDSQTQLSKPGAADAAASGTEARAAQIAGRASGLAQLEARSGLTFRQFEYLSILGDAFGTDPSGKPIDPAKRVDEHFSALHDFVAASDSRPAPLEASLQKMQALYQALNQAGGGAAPGQALTSFLIPGGGAAGTSPSGAAGTSPAAQLQALSRDTPPLVAAMLAPIAPALEHAAERSASQDIVQAWKEKVAPLCQAVFNRYPFLGTAEVDVPLDDFVRLVGPGGGMDQFFDQYLKAFVDQSQKPWRWRVADRAPLGLSPDALGAFERAAQIREALFTGGSQQVQVKFELVPVELDPQIARLNLDIGGQVLSWEHGPPESTQFQWPAQGGRTAVRLTMTPIGGDHALITEKNGPWSLLRLFDPPARLDPTPQPDKFRLTFTDRAGGTATFDLNASSVRNPFGKDLLHGFHCPSAP